MATRIRDLSPRFGIGEWFGKSVTLLTAQERRKFAREVLKPKRDRTPQPCPFQATKSNAMCSKEGGVCSLGLYTYAAHPENGRAIGVPVDGPQGELRATCPYRFHEAKTAFNWVSETVLGDTTPNLVGEDADVAAVWKTIFNGKPADVEWLKRQILDFEVNLENVREILDGKPRAVRALAFRTIVRNRMQRGGIMAAGAGLVKAGEAGRGLHSRWYPETLGARIDALRAIKDRVTFEEVNAFEAVKRYAKDPDAFFFIDPPYTTGGKNAGKRLYTHNEIDHEGLFTLMASVKGSVMLTYDDTSEVRTMAEMHGFRVEPVPMKNTHHELIRELLILKP